MALQFAGPFEGRGSRECSLLPTVISSPRDVFLLLRGRGRAISSLIEDSRAESWQRPAAPGRHQLFSRKYRRAQTARKYAANTMCANNIGLAWPFSLPSVCLPLSRVAIPRI